MIHAYNYLVYLLETDEKALEKFKWVGNIVTYLAALLISVSIVVSQTAWPFILYTIGNLVWIRAAMIAKDRPLFWLQVFFVAINLYAIYLRIYN